MRGLITAVGKSSKVCNFKWGRLLVIKYQLIRSDTEEMVMHFEGW